MAKSQGQRARVPIPFSFFSPPQKSPLKGTEIIVPKIAFCVALYNRWDTFRQLLASLAALEDPYDFELVVADFGSTDKDVKDAMASTRFVSRVGVTKGDFNRSVGRNAAAAHTMVDDDGILFFVDADMLVPPNFCELIRKSVQPFNGYFPICYSLYEGKPAFVYDDEPPPGGDHGWKPRRANGWWRTEGKGNCGFTKKDFLDLGGWDESLGTTYGDEDVNLYSRASKKFTLHRPRVPGLFHQWHGLEQRKA